MPDFLDRYGAQLHAAQSRSAALGPRRTPRTVARRRAALIALAVLVLAAPALALTRPWDPVLGRPDIDGGTPSTSAAPLVVSVRDSLAVLRREQTEQDRRLAEPLLRALNPRTEGVQLEGVRALRDGYALIPVKRVEIAPNRHIDDAICLSDGASLGCHPAQSVPETGVVMLSTTETQTRIWGVVPDGVARVRFEPEGHAPVETTVEANFFGLSVDALEPARRVPAPPGYPGPSMIPGPPTPVSGVVRWLDEHGRVVGPARQ
jgi:hypothetical protein